MGARALYMMDCGVGEFDYGTLVAMQHPGEKVLLPFSACLIDTDDGPVLVETGVNPDGRRDPAAAAGERARTTKLSLGEEDDIRMRLKEVGLSPLPSTQTALSAGLMCATSSRGCRSWTSGRAMERWCRASG